jgi:hypothetical protein
MAERGSGYKQIVEKYFPGTTLSGASTARAERATAPATDAAPAASYAATTTAADAVIERAHFSHPSPLASYMAPAAFVSNAAAGSRQNGRLSLSSEHFRVSYPARTARREIEAVLRALEGARADVERRLRLANLEQGGAAATARSLDVVIHETTPDFITATGQPGWVAAATAATRMELQPLALLRRRGVLLPTLRHEYVHVVIERLGRGRTPRWLAEGLAVYVAGEGAMLARFNPKSGWTREELERRLQRPASAEEMRALYAASYEEVRALIRAEGETNLWRRVAQG